MIVLDIAFDLDGTLIHLMPVFEEILWDLYKAVVPRKRSFKIYTEPDLPYDTIKECFDLAFEQYEKIEIHSGVKQLFEKLYDLTEKKDPIRIITARPISSAVHTYKLVNRICDNVDSEVIIVEDSDNKIKHLNRYSYFVDDRRKTSLHLASFGKTVFMPVKHYNTPLPKKHEGIIMIDSITSLYPIADTFIKEVVDDN